MERIEKTVFISYRRKDITSALAVYQSLVSEGYDVFYDYQSISGGDFENVILQNIKARAHFILILTPTALEGLDEPGDWFRREIEIAIDERRNIILLFFDGFSFSSPNIAEKLTGKLAAIRRYNGLAIEPNYFAQGMQRLRERYLDVPLDAVLQPQEVRDTAEKSAVAANEASQTAKVPVPAEIFLIYATQDKLALRDEPSARAYTWKRMNRGTELICLESKTEAKSKLGINDQWIHVQDPIGDQGYVAAWAVSDTRTEPRAGASAISIENIQLGELAFFPTVEVALRSQPVIAPDTSIRQIPPTEMLISLEPANQAIPKVGVTGQWLKVRDASNREGYVAAWYLRYAAGSQSDTAQEVPTAPPILSGILKVEAAADAVALRKQPVISDDTLIKRLPLGTEFTITEPNADTKVGRNDQWLKVKDPGGEEGYIAAWLVKAVPSLDEDARLVNEVIEAANAQRLQAAIEANRLINNRSQRIYNDRAEGEDQLGIKEEVYALAETLLLRDVEPPVAVGVMGGWGSGKSFVMYLISKYVEETRAKPVRKGWPDSKDDKDPKIPTYVGHIYQIHFNAWTYAKSNLWASLMDAIFSTLNRQMQLERLFAYQEITEDGKLPTPEELRPSLMKGGNIFKNIYLEDYQLDQDPELVPEEKSRLQYWSEKLLSHNLLWQVMRNQNREALKEIRKDEEKLEEYKARRATLEKNRDAETVSISKLDDYQAKSTYLSLLQSTLLTVVSDELSKTTREKLKENAIEEDNLLALKDRTETLVKGSRGLLNAFSRNKYYWFAGLSIAALTILFPYLWERLGKPAIDKAVTGGLALFTAVAPLIPTFLTRWQSIVDFEEKTKEAFEKAYEGQQARQAEKIATAENQTLAEKVKLLEEEVKRGSLPACNVLIQLKENQIEQQRRKIGPAAKYSDLMEFVQSRLDAATYENQLGLMHQVRQDIDELTYSLVDSANKDVFPRGKPRVILYIDDLDRCPPTRVIEVLEAIQLLLSTKLFIVVLGLDTRYVTRALEKEYKEILQHEGDPSGLDYIEKIIQIPYRVRPIESERLKKYLNAQMDIEAEIVQAASQVGSIHDVQFNQPQSGAEHDTLTPTQMPTNVASQPDEDIELPAAVIQFKQEDLADLTTCCQKIALTPRSIKRVVNVLKLIKIFWFRAEKDNKILERDRPRVVKQAAMCLLALSSAYPEVMREAFVHLEMLYNLGQERAELFTALNGVKLPPGTAPEILWQLQKFKGDLGTFKAITADTQTAFGHITLQDLNYSTFNLIRSFSFVGDPIYWTDYGEDTSRGDGNSQAKSTTRAKRGKRQSTVTGLTGNLDANGGK